MQAVQKVLFLAKLLVCGILIIPVGLFYFYKANK